MEEQARELAAEEQLHACPGARAFHCEHPIDGRAVLEQTWCSAPVPGATAPYGVHAFHIGRAGRAVDPWRE